MRDNYFWLGASADADQAGGLRPEPAPQSQPEALIPCAWLNWHWDCTALHPVTERKAGFLEGFAAACASLSHALCGEPDAGKSYDPMKVDLDRLVMHSYVFEMKEGGRHHPLRNYSSIGEIASLLMTESLELIRDSGARDAA